MSRFWPIVLDRGRGHAFQVNPAVCSGCHHGEAPYDATIGRQIHDEAGALLDELLKSPTGGATGRPRHAEMPALTNDRIGRAVYDTLLVFEDPAAGVHNAPFARALLEAARTGALK